MWPELLREDELRIPKEILEEQGGYLKKMTEGLVYAEVEDISRFDDDVEELELDDQDLAFKFSLRSKFMERYSFTLFAFTHGIDIYPVRMQLDYLVAKEIGLNRTLFLESEDEFITSIKIIFGANRTKTIIGSISKLAQSYK
jgi:hypothetical protein